MMMRYFLFRCLPCLLIVACGDGSGDADEAAPNDGSAPGRRGASGEANASVATGAPGEVPLKIELSAGGDRAELTGMGRCTHAKEASIYGVPASLWQIQDSDTGEIGHASLTVWRPASGGADQFSMAVASGDRDHRISTVKGGEIVGTGSVTMHTTGAGAHFEVVGTDGDGRSFRATFQCERFTEHMAEGG
jgi:hypothetical protein